MQHTGAAVRSDRQHTAVPPVTTGQTLAQRPQLSMSYSDCSHPLLSTPSQSAQPSRQVMAQRPSAQVDAAMLRRGMPADGHTSPHPPQWLGSVWNAASQPLALLPSQSP